MKKSRSGIVLFAAAAVVLIVLAVLPIDALAEIRTKCFLIQGDGTLTLYRVLGALLAVAAVIVCYFIIKWICAAAGKESDRARTVAGLVAGVVKYVAVIAAIVWGLSVLGVNTTAVLAGVGIIGLILGFGAQSLIEDVITGVFIIFENQYNVGDIIVLDDFRGTVREIGVRTTVIEDAGGNLKIVNNSEIRKLQNRSRNASMALCLVSVSYSTDLKKLEEIFDRALPEMFEPNSDLYLAAPTYLGVEEFQDSGILLKLAVSVAESNVFAAKRRLNRDIKLLFDRESVTIPFPQVVVHKGEA